jgi:hypothetical protein
MYTLCRRARISRFPASISRTESALCRRAEHSQGLAIGFKRRRNVSEKRVAMAYEFGIPKRKSPTYLFAFAAVPKLKVERGGRWCRCSIGKPMRKPSETKRLSRFACLVLDGSVHPHSLSLGKSISSLFLVSVRRHGTSGIDLYNAASILLDESATENRC